MPKGIFMAWEQAGLQSTQKKWEEIGCFFFLLLLLSKKIEN
jgi:hypothetical protein